jgi:hypothetical protein
MISLLSRLIYYTDFMHLESDTSFIHALSSGADIDKDLLSFGGDVAPAKSVNLSLVVHLYLI